MVDVQNYLDQIDSNYKFLYSMDLHNKMYTNTVGKLDFRTGENFRKIGKHGYYGNTTNRIITDFGGDKLLENAETAYNQTGALKVGATYMQVVSNRNNTEPFFISNDDINVNYRFEVEDGLIKTFGHGYPMVISIKK